MDHGAAPPPTGRGTRGETAWVLLSAGLLYLAQRPWAALPGWAEAWLPAVLIVIAPAPLLAAFARSGGARRASGWALVWWGLGGWWVTRVDPLLGFFAWLGMVLFAAAFTWPLGTLLGWLRVRRGADAMLWLAPLLWCGWELARTWGPFGCPWFAVAHGLWKLPVLCQVAEVTGYRGLTLPLITVSAGLARLMLGDRRAGAQLALGAVLFALIAGYGAWRLPRVDDLAGRPVRVALLQANVPLEDKAALDLWALFDRHTALLREVPAGTELVVWPETAVPGPVFEIDAMRAELRAAARRLGATFIVGAVHPRHTADGRRQVTNAAFVMAPDGRLADVYAKVHLVILGEYLPAREWPVVRSLAKMTPQYWAGRRFRAVATPVGRLGIPICYESAFAGDVRAMVRDGATALCALTNDDQLTEVGARQLYQQTVFRAIESRRWLARCANSGISCFVAPSGRVDVASRWDARTVCSGTIRLRQEVTIYQRYGDWLAWLCLAAVLAALIRPRKADGA